MSLCPLDDPRTQNMADQDLDAIRQLLERCSADERHALFREMADSHNIHEYEKIVGAPAEMILEAIHRAPELTRRMLRGVIADAAFAKFIVPGLAKTGWTDVTPEGNFAYDYKMRDHVGDITVQVKLQRSELGKPAERRGARYGFAEMVYLCETQKTRTGTDDKDEKTRPYRYGEFDILAVSMQPSTGRWDRYMYTVGKWLLKSKSENEIAVMQPVEKVPNSFWTDDFDVAATWFRSVYGDKRIAIVPRPVKVKAPAKRTPVAKKARKSTPG